MAPLPADLETALRNHTVVPFVGAGLSLTLGTRIFPDWKGLIERFAERLDREQLPARAAEVRQLIAADRLVPAAEYAAEALTKPRYMLELLDAFDRNRPARVDLSAVEAVWRLNAPLVITTNFDRVLEWPFDAPSNFPYDPPNRVLRVGDNANAWFLSQLEMSAWTDDAVIWHLHGTITRPDSIVLTTTDFSDLYGPDDGTGAPHPRNENANRVLSSVIAGRRLLFVGFSLGDPYLLNQLRRLLRLTQGNNPVSYLLVRKGEKEADALLKEFKIQLVEFDDFGPPMLARLNDLVAAANPDARRIEVSGDTAPALAPLISDLEGRIAGLAPEPAFVANTFNACKPEFWRAFPPSGDGVMLLRAAIGRLAEASLQSTGGHPLLIFVRALADTQPEQSASLAQWIDSAIDALASTAQERNRLRAALNPAAAVPAAAPYVLVRILLTPGEETWSVQAWLFAKGPQPIPLFDDETPYAPTDSEKLVADLLNGLASHDVPEEDAVIAFLVPQPLLREDIHRWRPAMKLGAEPALGSTCAVTVRPLERTNDRPSRRVVQQRWQSLKAAKGPLPFADLTKDEAPAAPVAVWITPDTRGGPGLVRRLRRWGVSHAILAGLGTIGESPGTTLLENLVQAQVPVIAWVRDLEGLSEDEIRALINTEPLLELPQRLRERRGLEEERSEIGLASQVALLWDAADYLPPDQDPDNRALSPL